MLTVCKASAGSGKTFQLVAEFLKIVLRNPPGYRNILAVTFTNKATGEMKSRILEQLHLLACKGDSPYMELLRKEINCSEEAVRQKAGVVLKYILHDYNRFSVSTIDSFTQGIIRAFNREMGISPNFILELDNDRVLEEAVDRLIARVDTDKPLRKWLIQFSREKIRENRSQHIERDIRLLGAELFREKFQLFFSENSREENPYSRENLESFRAELDKIKAWYENTLKKRAGECMLSIRNSGFSTDDFFYKQTGVAGYLNSLSEGNLKEPGKRVLEAAESEDKWFSGKHNQKASLEKLVKTTLQPMLCGIIEFYQENRVIYRSAIEVRKELWTLGILADLKEEVKLLLHEEGVLQLSDSNLLLSKIIGDCDAPFIYEKTGIRFNYFMLDEFQDTSMLQWSNFKPLVANALAEGYPALLVGDVKQAIYRWRNSDWNILASQIHADFPSHSPLEVFLEKNWRSLPNIIAFNNAVIDELKQAFEHFLFDDIDEPSFRDRFSQIYRHLRQEQGRPSAEHEGLAEISFLPEEAFEERSCELLAEQVKRLQDAGLKASDIAILIRKNQEGTKIVNAFLTAAKREENAGYNLSVLSNESLFLNTSRGVNFVIMALEILTNSESPVQKVALLHLWQSWLKPVLKEGGLGMRVSERMRQHVFLPKTEIEWSVDQNFESVFETEIGHLLEQLRQKVLLSSLDELITQICSLFDLFAVESELPFLQTLIDLAAERKMSLFNDVSNFLYWWNEKGMKSSVQVNEEVDSVRLLTVHKSKGLEFEAVIVPFFNWNVASWSGTQAPLLWCMPASGPFNRFPLLPVKASGKLAGTIFRNDYFEEKVNSYIDTMNLVYVAYTRARSVLFVNCKKSEGKGEGPERSVNAFLEYSLQNMAGRKPFDDCWNTGESVFSFGKLPPFALKRDTEIPGWIKSYQFNDLSERIRLRVNSEDFLVDEEHERSVKNTGKLLHEILAGVKMEKDLEPSCDRAFREGRITWEEREMLFNQLKNRLSHPEIRHWFDGSLNVLNERNILTPSGIFRPDRVMVDGNRAVVVDYKWGIKRTAAYRKQVESYGRHLYACGFEQVEGYIWYINQDELEQVM